MRRICGAIVRRFARTAPDPRPRPLLGLAPPPPPSPSPSIADSSPRPVSSRTAVGPSDSDCSTHDEASSDDSPVLCDGLDGTYMCARGLTLREDRSERSVLHQSQSGDVVVYRARVHCSDGVSEHASELVCTIKETASARRHAELQMMLRAGRHPAIPLLIASQERHGISRHYFLCDDLCECDVLAILDGIKDSPQARIALMMDVVAGACDALRYLHHTAHIAHCDIKPENLVWSRNCGTRVIDFDLAFEWTPGGPPEKRRFPGTVEYSPLEILQCLPYMPDKRDTFSLAVTAFVIVFAVPVYTIYARSGCFDAPAGLRPTLQLNCSVTTSLLLGLRDVRCFACAAPDIELTRLGVPDKYVDALIMMSLFNEQRRAVCYDAWPPTRMIRELCE